MIDDGSVNREKTCPLLLRMFCSTKKHNNVIEYTKGKTPVNELQVYTWLDATLKELASLVKQVNPESRKRGTLFDFALVFPDQRSPNYKMREIGSVCAGLPSDTDRIMLKDVHFSIGDMIDVAITLPQPNPSNNNNNINNNSNGHISANRSNGPALLNNHPPYRNFQNSQSKVNTQRAGSGYYNDNSDRRRFNSDRNRHVIPAKIPRQDLSVAGSSDRQSQSHSQQQTSQSTRPVRKVVPY